MHTHHRLRCQFVILIQRFAILFNKYSIIYQKKRNKKNFGSKKDIFPVLMKEKKLPRITFKEASKQYKQPAET